MSASAVKVRVQIDTDLVKDVFFLRAKSTDSVADFINVVHKRYQEWHGFPVYEFELEDSKVELLGDLTKPDEHVLQIKAIESFASKKRRELEKKTAEEEKARREKELRDREEARRLRIMELSDLGNCWSFENIVPSLDVPVELDGLVVRNKGSVDQWCPIHRVRAILGTGKSYFAVKIVKDAPTTNTWKFCVGVIPMGFKLNAERRWVGSQKSWGYIGGNGGKCYNSGKNENYGAKFGEGDVIGVYMDFDLGFLEFYKNGVSQGIAYKNLTGPVYPAVSLTGKDTEIALVEDYPPSLAAVVKMNESIEEQRLRRWKEISDEEFHSKRVALAQKGENSWDVRFSITKDKALYFPDEEIRSVVNEGSADKWRSVRSIGTYSKGICYFEIVIDKDSPTVNTWRICIGVVPIHFRCDGPRSWVGSQESWGYIAGTGGKTYNSGQTIVYGEPYEQGDVIGVLMDFPGRTIEFFRNGISQGVAFDNLIGPVHAAASLTGTNTKLTLRNVDAAKFEEYRKRANEQASTFSSVIQKFGNVWDSKKCSKDIVLEENGLRATNPGSGNKWRTVASLLPYSSGRRYFEVVINESPSCSNSWRIIIGLVPRSFDFTSSKVWVGSQNSWGYISGTGGKCRNSSKSSNYGSKFSKGDRIGCLMDFENRTIEFFKNGTSQGQAFQDLSAPVFAAVSLTASGASITIDASAENKQEIIDSLFLYK
jgi:hypothetical protein